MKSDVVGCLGFPSPRGMRYLCGFDSLGFGAELLPYFADNSSMAFPLTSKQADFVLSRIDFDVRKRLRFISFPRADLEPDLFTLEHSPIGGVI